MKYLDHLEEWLITFLMAGATLIIFVSVVHRYAAGLSIPVVQDWLLTLNFTWAQELTIIMFVWMAKFGAAYGVRTGIHVGVDVLINRLDEKLRAKFIIFGLLAGATFTGGTWQLVRVGERCASCISRNERQPSGRYTGRTDHTRFGVADMDGVFGDPARHQSDVLPFSASADQLHQDRGLAAS